MNDSNARYTLSALAERFDLELIGDGDHEVSRVDTLQSAQSDCIAFLSNPLYRVHLASTGAGAVIMDPEDAVDCPVNCLVGPNPYASYAKIARLFNPRPAVEPSKHPSAHIDKTTRLGRHIHISSGVVIGANCWIGDNCVIGPGCVISDGCRLGDGSTLVANVTLCDNVQLGERVIIHPGAVIGADGFGIAHAGDSWERVPQLGGVEIGSDSNIGANTCIDRGAIGNTVIGEDVHIDNLCQIGHNCTVGAHTAMAAFTGIAGSTHIGEFCLFGGRSGAHGHLNIADRTTVAAVSVVNKDVTEPGTTWAAAIPAQPIREWQRTLSNLRRLSPTVKRINKLEKESGK